MSDREVVTCVLVSVGREQVTCSRSDEPLATLIWAMGVPTSPLKSPAHNTPCRHRHNRPPSPFNSLTRFDSAQSLIWLQRQPLFRQICTPAQMSRNTSLIFLKKSPFTSLSRYLHGSPRQSSHSISRMFALCSRTVRPFEQIWFGFGLVITRSRRNTQQILKHYSSVVDVLS